MPKNEYLIALDQGTSSSRAVVFGGDGSVVASASSPLAASYPHSGWVEQDARAIVSTQLSALSQVVQGIDARQIRGIGITNQRETLIVWDRKTGAPLAPAIVWQCRRSAEICERLTRDGHAPRLRELTGLVVDAYFSGSKIVWLLENMPGIKEKCRAGNALFGTVDSWLIYNLSRAHGHPVFVTEPSNASRTMLFDIEAGDWSDELLGIFGITRANLPHVLPSAAEFTNIELAGRKIPVRAVLGDQQASLFGHACFRPSQLKCTFGTGAFLLKNEGKNRPNAAEGVLTTIAWTLETNGQCETTYATEGSIFIAGALIDWLVNGLGIVPTPEAVETFASAVSDTNGVTLVPAFVGLGAPYWNQEVRGAVFGLNRDTKAAHICRAALEAIAQQVADILEISNFSDARAIAVDGGMIKNRLFCQILADITGRVVHPSRISDTTALGVAALAARAVGSFDTDKPLETEFILKSGKKGALSPASTDVSATRKQWKRAIKALLATTGC